MVTIRLLVLGATLLLAACGGGMPKIRPVAAMPDGASLAPFDRAYQTGKASMQRNQIGLALILFQKALLLEPDSVAALNAVGAAYDELHFPNLAARYYARALELEPRSADTLNNLAVSAALAGKTEQARTLFAAALAIETGNPILLANLHLLEGDRLRQGAAMPAEALLAARPTVERIGMASFLLTVGKAAPLWPPTIAPAETPLAMLPPTLIAMNR
jgi:tetratricopeptide (TPR) repeat protein